MERIHSKWRRRQSAASEDSMVLRYEHWGMFHSLKNHKKSFHKHFPAISETESLINVFTCALQKEVLYHGKMFISDQRVCFHSSVLLKETKVEIDLSEIQFIKKKNTARVVPNAISITKSGEKYLFGSLLNRDACFKFLQTICPQLKVISANGSPQVSSADNFYELEADAISSYSSQEDSADSQCISVLERDKKRGRNVLHPSSSSKSSHAQTKSGSTTQSNTNREENTAVSWVTMVTKKIKSLLSTSSTTNVNKVLVIYLILAMLLLLSSGYIGLRIAALEKQLNTLGENPEFSLQKEYRET
ncbi:GRAM domain-containing protein 2B-like [Trichomycterus rosablanca]|uniref:GRAM domain-containing protein 2B-like n=1 Tax=Trichomycterus rosablanca TaxID=2290929 RepID=UPI002F35B6CB